MQFMRFLYNAPAILHKSALIVGDTHFGIEEKLRRKGVYDEQFSLRLFSRLKELILKHGAKKLILLGDVKDNVTALDQTTEGILSRLAMLCEVIVVKGNHDGGIENCGNVKVMGAGGFVYEGLGLVHGHSWPAEELMRCRYIVMGHQHPMIAIADAFGKRHHEPVWIIAPCNRAVATKHYQNLNKAVRLILMPAFNPLVGSSINTEDNRRLGPVLNNKLFKLNHAIVFRLDGTCLGKLENIQ